jgi:hypothetical protein
MLALRETTSASSSRSRRTRTWRARRAYAACGFAADPQLRDSLLPEGLDPSLHVMSVRRERVLQDP